MDIEKNTISQDDSTLENFSTEEIKVLNLFFTNTSSSIFFAKNTLPPELVGALSSRYII